MRGVSGPDLRRPSVAKSPKVIEIVRNQVSIHNDYR